MSANAPERDVPYYRVRAGQAGILRALIEQGLPRDCWASAIRLISELDAIAEERQREADRRHLAA